MIITCFFYYCDYYLFFIFLFFFFLFSPSPSSSSNPYVFLSSFLFFSVFKLMVLNFLLKVSLTLPSYFIFSLAYKIFKNVNNIFKYFFTQLPALSAVLMQYIKHAKCKRIHISKVSKECTKNGTTHIQLMIPSSTQTNAWARIRKKNKETNQQTNTDPNQPNNQTHRPKKTTTT